MKKLLLLSALAIGAMTVKAADITFFMAGEPFENGAELVSSRIDENRLLYAGVLLLDPEITYETSENINLDITVINTTPAEYQFVNAGGFLAPVIQFCWPAQCIDIQAGATGAQSGNTGTALRNNLSIDSTLGTVEEGKDYLVSCNVSIVMDGDTANPFEFNLKMVYPGEDNAVESVLGDEVAPVYYNLNGCQIANPEKGIFIKKQGNKVSKVVL